MIILDATTKSIELATSAAVSLDYSVAYADITTSAFTPSNGNGNISTATTTTIVAAPASSTQRQIKFMSFVNRSTTTSNTLTLKLDVSGTEYVLGPAFTLGPSESLQWSADTGFQAFTASGLIKMIATETTGYNGFPRSFYKVGTALEAAGVMYGWWKDSGLPGAWAPGTPGLAGRTTDGTTTTDAGCLLFQNASSGSIYLSKMDVAASVACQVQLWDVLWVNSGAVVTTTTGQTINSVTLPSRDHTGSTNGEGIGAAIIVTTATTNAGAITNTTLTYTNSQGTGSRTATISSFPATAVIGTVVQFQLQAGDTGIRSIQTLTLGTSYGGGAISLIMYRPLLYAPVLVANSGTAATNSIVSPGIKCYSGSCILPFQLGTATTATTVHGQVTFIER